jgi:hypothetical protein
MATRSLRCRYADLVRSPGYMLDDFAPNVSAVELERTRRDALCPSERVDAISYDWSRIGMGIVLAGGAYPIVVAAIGLALALIIALLNSPYGAAVGEGVGLVFGFAIYTVFAALVGILWSGLVTVLTLPIIYLFAWSLSLTTSIVRIGAFSGGLVGFICVLPLTLSVPWYDFGGDIWQVVFMITLGPMLTTILGQLGGAWGGSKSRAIGPARNWNLLVGPAAGEPTTGNPTDVHEKAPPSFQFGIRHLLWISVWLSLLLALIRVSGIPFELMLPLLLGWIVFQSATIWIGGLLLPRLSQWRARRRQFRST